MEITSSRMGHLWEALCRGFDVLGFDQAAGEDEVFRQLVLARIIEPTSKQDSLRVLGEVGVEAVSYPTVNRRLPVYAEDDWRGKLKPPRSTGTRRPAATRGGTSPHDKGQTGHAKLLSRQRLL